MTTELRKTVQRRTAEPYDHHGRRIIVSLESGDVISFREERTRTRFTAPISRVFRQVLLWNVDARRAAMREPRPEN